MSAGAAGGEPPPCVVVRPRTSPIAEVGWTIELRQHRRPVKMIVQTPNLDAALVLARRFAIEHGYQVEGAAE